AGLSILLRSDDYSTPVVCGHDLFRDLSSDGGSALCNCCLSAVRSARNAPRAMVASAGIDAVFSNTDARTGVICGLGVCEVMPRILFTLVRTSVKISCINPP